MEDSTSKGTRKTENPDGPPCDPNQGRQTWVWFLGFGVKDNMMKTIESVGGRAQFRSRTLNGP